MEVGFAGKVGGGLSPAEVFFFVRLIMSWPGQRGARLCRGLLLVRLIMRHVGLAREVYVYAEAFFCSSDYEACWFGQTFMQRLFLCLSDHEAMLAWPEMRGFAQRLSFC